MNEENQTEKRTTGSLHPACSAAPDVEALGKWMHEVTQLLCFQPDVPMQHKTDLCNALNEYNMVKEAQRLAQQNAKLRDAGESGVEQH